MPPDAVRAASPADRDRLVAATVAAFADDPEVRWFFPDDHTWARAAGAFFATMLDLRLEGGVVDVVADATGIVQGGAQWDPPGGLDLPPGRDDAAWGPVTAAWDAATRERFAALEEAAARARPDGPHAYLGVIAVDPQVHGRGFGRQLLDVGLARVDRTGRPSFLETSTERNVARYERLGFAVTLVADMPDAGPRIWFMTRPAADVRPAGPAADAGQDPPPGGPDDGDATDAAHRGTDA